MEAAREVLQLHNAAVRETLSTCNGYECKEFNGSFMTTFAMPTGELLPHQLLIRLRAVPFSPSPPWHPPYILILSPLGPQARWSGP